MAKKLESGAGKLETDRKAEAKPSEDPRDQQPSTSQAAPPYGETLLPPELEERLGERIAAEVERRFQSAKDRRWAKLERQFGALREFQESLQEGDNNQGSHASASNPDDWLERKTRDLLDSVGLMNDPEVQAMFRGGEYNPDAEGYLDFLGDITKLALQRAGRPTTTPATVAQPSGGGAPKPDLRSEYDLRKAGMRPGDINALMELKREFRQKGLDVF